jgi:hypothetical protein
VQDFRSLKSLLENVNCNLNLDLDMVFIYIFSNMLEIYYRYFFKFVSSLKKRKCRELFSVKKFVNITVPLSLILINLYKSAPFLELSSSLSFQMLKADLGFVCTNLA